MQRTRSGLVAALAFAVTCAACTSGPMKVREEHYFAVPNGSNTNYYRLRVTADTEVGVSEYRSGWFPASAVDSLFGDVSAEGTAEAYASRRKLQEGLQKGIETKSDAWLKEAANPDADLAELQRLMAARRRVLAYPRSIGDPFPNSIEVEFNPVQGLVITHSDEKLVFVLASDPDEVVGRIANFAESDKTVYSVNRLAGMLTQRASNEVVAREAQERIAKQLDGVVHGQVGSALAALKDLHALAGSGAETAKRTRALSEIDTLLAVLDALRN